MNGYNNIPCREECCRAAVRRYFALRQLSGTRGTVSSLGAKRRIQALMALGWTTRAIGEAAGYASVDTQKVRIRQILQQGETINIHTARRIEKAYDTLSMRIPTSSQASSRAQRTARRNGWLPPLAWDNIDDPNERPTLGAGEESTEVDEVLVQRILEGDGSVASQATKTERLMVIHAWTGRGRSQSSLGRLTGWNISRDLREEHQASHEHTADPGSGQSGHGGEVAA